MFGKLSPYFTGVYTDIFRVQASTIKKCIMLPYNGEDSCDAVIDKASRRTFDDCVWKPIADHYIGPRECRQNPE